MNTMKLNNQKKPFKIQQNIIMLFATVILLGLFSLVNPNLIMDKYMILSMIQNFAPYAVMGLGVTFVIATGGLSQFIAPLCKRDIKLERDLLLKGLNIIYKKNMHEKHR